MWMPTLREQPAESKRTAAFDRRIKRTAAFVDESRRSVFPD
jgi:hypothetical protein